MTDTPAAPTMERDAILDEMDRMYGDVSNATFKEFARRLRAARSTPAEARRFAALMETDALTEDRFGSTPAEALDTEQLRYILWIAHGHDGLYGDDGEMQCSQCGPDWDYLRGDLPRLIERVANALDLAHLSRNEEAER